MDQKMYINGLQHIGIPVENIEVSIGFYESLEFKVIYKVYYEPKEQWICFMESDGLVLELYEEKGSKTDGAVNHFALDCLDIEIPYAKVVGMGYEVVSDGIEDMDIWSKGVRYFIIKGPDRERIEFCQKL